jgi:GxxExxY protein
MPIFYKSRQIGTRRVDFLIKGVVAVELKALTQLEDVHLAQAINYLEAYDLEIGLLINFGAKCLEYKRIVNKKFNQKNQGNPIIKQCREPEMIDGYHEM